MVEQSAVRLRLSALLQRVVLVWVFFRTWFVDVNRWMFIRVRVVHCTSAAANPLRFGAVPDHLKEVVELCEL